MGRTPAELSIGWLDLGSEDQRRAKNFIAQFHADNTLDELGIGVLRDAFAELFFPATNTIMTRTRYLIFVAGLCWIVEEEGLEGRRAAQRLTHYENKLREALSREEAHGVIGAQAKEELQRFPSSTYWSALRQLGIFCRSNWGLTYYQDHLRDIHRAGAADVDDDRLTHVDIPVQRNWDRKLCELLSDGRSFLPDGKRDVSTSLNFALTRSEARYLRERFVALAGVQGQPSILSHVLSIGVPCEFDYPWEAPCPIELRPQVRHARYLSMFARGVTLQYFHLLSVERARLQFAQHTDVFQSLFDDWWQSTRIELAKWDTSEFFAVADTIDPARRTRRSDRTFITSWLERNRVARNGRQVIADDEAGQLIRDREHVARPNKGRLRHPDYLKRWRAPEPADLTGPFGLNYRARIGATFVADIVDGLGGA